MIDKDKYDKKRKRRLENNMINQSKTASLSSLFLTETTGTDSLCTSLPKAWFTYVLDKIAGKFVILRGVVRQL